MGVKKCKTLVTDFHNNRCFRALNPHFYGQKQPHKESLTFVTHKIHPTLSHKPPQFNHEIVDCGASCKAIFLCISALTPRALHSLFRQSSKEFH